MPKQRLELFIIIFLHMDIQLKVYWCVVLMSFSSFDIRIMLFSEDELGCLLQFSGTIYIALILFPYTFGWIWQWNHLGMEIYLWEEISLTDKRLFKLMISSWLIIDSLCIVRNLSISLKLSSLLASNFAWYSLIILLISVVPVEMSPVSLLIFLIIVRFLLFSLVSFTRCLSIPLIFWKN